MEKEQLIPKQGGKFRFSQCKKKNHPISTGVFFWVLYIEHYRKDMDSWDWDRIEFGREWNNPKMNIF